MFRLGERVGVVLGLGVVGVCGVLASTIPPPAPAARAGATDPQEGALVFETVEHEFGEITDEGSIEMRFPFTNTGMHTVTINRLHSYCGCTTPDLEKDVYAPGESGVIRVNFDPTGRHGIQVKRIMVYTDDPVLPVKTITARGYVRAVAYLEPNVINFGVVDKGTSLSKVVYVLGEKADFAVTGVEPTNPDILGAEILASAPVDTDGVTMQRWTIRVDLLGVKRSGRYAEQLKIFTNDERRSELSLNVIVRVPTELKLGWGMIRVGKLAVGESLEEQILLKHERGVPFKITSIDSESQNLDLTFEWTEPENPEDAHTITIRGSAIKGGGAITDRVVITTDLEDEEPMTVAFRGIVVDPDRGAKPKPEAEKMTEGIVEIED